MFNSSFQPTTITFTHRACPALISSSPLFSAIGELQMCYRPTAAGVCHGASQLDLIFIRMRVFSVTSFLHLACFAGHNFPLWWPLYWRLGLSRCSRVKPGSWLSEHSPLRGHVWLTCSKRAFLPLPLWRHALLPHWNKPPTEKTGTLAGCHKTNSVLHGPGMCRSHMFSPTETHTHRWQTCRLRQYKLMVLLCRGFKGSMGDN